MALHASLLSAGVELKLLYNRFNLQVWKEGMTKCILEKSPAAIELDALYKLKSEWQAGIVLLTEIGHFCGVPVFQFAGRGNQLRQVLTSFATSIGDQITS